MARYEKVAEAIKEEVSNIIHDELKDPRLGFITVTRAELTHDLRCAKIFFSVLGSEEEQAKSKKALDSAVGFIRRLIAQRIQLRFAPEISFKEDKSGEYSIGIQQVLDEIKELNQPRPSSDAVGGQESKKGGRVEPKKNNRLPKKRK